MIDDSQIRVLKEWKKNEIKIFFFMKNSNIPDLYAFEMFSKLLILFRALHEQFHIIRLNLSLAALGALVAFLLRDFLYDDEVTFFSFTLYIYEVILIKCHF